MTNSNTTLYINDPASGLRVEKVTGATGSVQWNDYLFAGGRMVAQHYNVTTGGVTTTSTSYFTLDHLGSIAVIADGSGAQPSISPSMSLNCRGYIQRRETCSNSADWMAGGLGFEPR